MKSLSVLKYSVNSMKKAMIIYYPIYILAIVVVCLVARGSSDAIEFKAGFIQGTDFGTVILMFVLGLCSFKESFYLMQSMNVSRKSFFKGIVLSVIPMAAICSVLDLILNRIFNLFINTPTIYDMAYGSSYESLGFSHYYIENNISTLFNIFIFQFFFLIFIFAVGFFITNLYYKCNTTMKVVVSILPIILINGYSALNYYSPKICADINKFFLSLSGVSSRNVYMMILTFVMGCIILNSLSFLMIRKAVVKN